MLKSPPVRLRLAYCLVLLGCVVPTVLSTAGFAAWSWGRGITKGASVLSSAFVVGPLLLCAFALYRIYLVVRVRSTLGSLEATGVPWLLRVLGLLGVYVGALATVLAAAAIPVTKLFTPLMESGPGFFLASIVGGMLMAIVWVVGPIGLFLFEFSRLRGFERLALEREQRKA